MTFPCSYHRRSAFGVASTLLLLLLLLSTSFLASVQGNEVLDVVSDTWFDISEKLSSRWDSWGSRASDALEAVGVNPWDDDEENKEKDWGATILDTTTSTSTALYGTALLLYSKQFPGQIHLITMMRATGFDKLEKMAKETRRNIRNAVLSLVWNSPKFLKANASIKGMQEHVTEAREYIRQTRLARADGTVTPAEAEALNKLKKAQIMRYKRDMKRLIRAGAGLGKVIKALDLDELFDILRNFLFQMMVVLASGHNDGLIGKLVSKWCLFLNLGSLFLDLNSKLGYPIARAIHSSSFLRDVVSKKEEALERTAEVILFGTAGHMVLYHNVTARHLNAALVSSAIIFKGLRELAETYLWGEDDVFFWTWFSNLLEGWTGGVLMLTMTAVGVSFRLKSERGQMGAPKWVLAPFAALEATIDRLVFVIDKVV